MLSDIVTLTPTRTGNANLNSSFIYLKSHTFKLVKKVLPRGLATLETEKACLSKARFGL